MGVLNDDRHPPLEDWLERRARWPGPRHPRRYRGLAADPARRRTRNRPRDSAAVINYMNYARPALLAWSSRYGNLREVTRDDVLAGVESGPGSVSVDVQDRGDGVLHRGSVTTSQPQPARSLTPYDR